MTSHKTVVFVDIDHVISDAEWRDSMLEGADKWQGWDHYHLHSSHDEAVVEIVELVNCMCDTFYVVGFTARPGKWRHLTNQWLLRHKVILHDLLMREDEDFRPAVDIKRDMVKNFLDRGSVIGLILDDRPDVCAHFRAMGITTLQVAIGRRKDETKDRHRQGLCDDRGTADKSSVPYFSKPMAPNLGEEE